MARFSKIRVTIDTGNFLAIDALQFEHFLFDPQDHILHMLQRLLSLICFFLCCFQMPCLPLHSQAAEPFLQKSILFSEKSDGYSLYRIPGIVVTTKGTVLVYCEARKLREADRGEIEIHLRRSVDGGKTFSPAIQVAHMGTRLPRNPHIPDSKIGKDLGGPDEQTVNNPVAIAARDGTVHMIYCVEYYRAFHISSTDDGVTWTAPQDITSAFDKFKTEIDWQAIATGPGHAIEIDTGRLCVPFWMANYENNSKLKKGVATIYSDDGGKTWLAGEIAIREAGEPNIARIQDGGVLLTARNSRPENRRLVSRSRNGATAWSEPVLAEELLEPGCMAGICEHPGTESFPGPLLLFSNPHTTDHEHSARRDVTIKLSRDSGKTWPISKVLQTGPSAYSDLAVLPDGTILCFYENGTDTPKIKRKRDWAYANLTLARFNLEWLMSNTP